MRRVGVEAGLIAQAQEQDRAAVALAREFASRPQGTGRVLKIFLATLIREWSEESVRRVLDEAEEYAGRTC